jgi:LPXTG-motif cell wall-anchored protein
MNIYEKAGDFLVNTSQLIVGGVILTNVVQEDFDGTTVYLIAGVIVVVLLGGAFGVYFLSKKNNK